MNYEDIEIQIRSTGPGKFDATVARAPFQGRPRVLFDAPLSRTSLEDLIAAADQRVREDLIGRQEETTETPVGISSFSPREIGQLLHQAVFRDELADLLRRCVARKGPREGLRLRFKFTLDDEEAEYLAGLPWELLCDPGSGSFFAIDSATPVVRDLAHPRPLSALRGVKLPLRILVVDAAPKAMKELKLGLEIERMQTALKPLVDAEQVELFRPEEPSPEAMRNVLLEHPIHILHFMGHGGFDSDSKMGAVFFADRDGSRDQMDGEALAAYLKNFEHLRLVVLNSCKTGRHAGHAGAPLYHGVASAVVERTGMPAVIANQYAISDDAAIDFSYHFYRRLADGAAVDEALSEARLRLWRKTTEWATPVLFLSAADGKLFEVEKSSLRVPAAGTGQVQVLASSGDGATEPPFHVGIRSRSGWGSSMEDEAARLLPLLEYFRPGNDRYIEDQSWWQEKVFPSLRSFLLEMAEVRRPLLLDFAAHQSIAFAAGWVLEAKSGLDVRVWQRTQGRPLQWAPGDGSNPGGPLWQERPDDDIAPDLADRAVAIAVSNNEVFDEVGTYVREKGLPVGRILHAAIAPEPGQLSVKGGDHSLRLAQTLVNRLRYRRPSERSGRLHLFASAPNALLFYLGQLSRSLGRIVLYEYAMDAADPYGKYQPSIELPPPDEVRELPPGW